MANANPNYGGLRPGAGRPKGSKNHATRARELTEKVQTALGKTGLDKDILAMGPLEIMAMAMGIYATQGNWQAAASIARDLAPYVAPKLSSVDINATSSKDASDYTSEQLLSIVGSEIGNDAEAEYKQAAA